MKKIYQLSQQDDPKGAVEVTVFLLQLLILNDAQDKVETLFSTVELEVLTTPVIYAMLLITFPYRRELRSRKRLLSYFAGEVLLESQSKPEQALRLIRSLV